MKGGITMSYNNDNDPRTNPKINSNTISGVMIGISLLSMLPFYAVGIWLIISGIGDLSGGTAAAFAMPKLIFGVVWTLILVFVAVYMIGTMRMSADKISRAKDIIDRRVEQNLGSDPIPSHDTGYQAPQYISPENDPRFDYEWMKHDSCKADHEDDEDSVMKGYE